MTKKTTILAAVGVALTISAVLYAADNTGAKVAGAAPVPKAAVSQAPAAGANTPKGAIASKTEIPSTPDTPLKENNGAAKPVSAAPGPSAGATALPAASAKPGPEPSTPKPAGGPTPVPAGSVAGKAAEAVAAPSGSSATPAAPFGPASKVAQVAPPAVTVSPQQPGTANPSADAAFYSEEGELTKKLRLMKLKLEIADTQRKLDNGGSEPAQGASGIAVMQPPAPLMPSAPTDGPGAGTSTVSSLAVPQQIHDAPRPAPTAGVHYVSYLVVGSTAQAMINVNGAVTPVARGSVLSDGWAVTDIQPTRLLLGKGRTSKSIQIGE